MSGENDHHLEITVKNFNLMVGIAWQLPDDAPVSLCVGESDTLQVGEAHCGIAQSMDHLGRSLMHLPCHHLVVRAGTWEWYPKMAFRRPFDNYPGVRVRAGDLRDACRQVVDVGTDLCALEALGPASHAASESVRVKFGEAGVTVSLGDVKIELQGV
jgi:hypothetical protein